MPWPALRWPNRARADLDEPAAQGTIQTTEMIAVCRAVTVTDQACEQVLAQKRIAISAPRSSCCGMAGTVTA